MLSGYKELFNEQQNKHFYPSIALEWRAATIWRERDGTEIVFPVHIQYTPTFPTV